VTVFWTNAIARLAANALSRVHDGHDFAFYFIIIFVFINNLTVFVQGDEGHDTSTTGFEAAATAEALVLDDFFQILGGPGFAPEGQSSYKSHGTVLLFSFKG
jgi:hypothetical protein